ncbi:MAG: hypothetical protein ACYTGH_17965, partial [Planctomycetota bacterium]
GYASFEKVPLPDGKALPAAGVLRTDWNNFIIQKVSLDAVEIDSLETRFRTWLKARYGTVAKLNQAYEAGRAAFTEVPLLAVGRSLNRTELQLWRDFIRERVSPERLTLDPSSQREYHAFLRGRFPNPKKQLDLAAMNKAYGTTYAKELEIYPPRALPQGETAARDWTAFVKERVSPRFVTLSTEGLGAEWTAYLSKRYGGEIAALNRAWGLVETDFSAVPAPYWEADALLFKASQDDSMWTLMVHIYQLMIRSSMGVSFAALVVASIPTFLVFVFCQNIIIRGIVVPTEK